MSGAQIIVDPRQLEGAAQVLDAMADRARDMTGLMDGIGAYLMGATVQNFDEQAAPDGTPWKPSIRATMEGGVTLARGGPGGGRLKGSFSYLASAHEVIVGTNTPYAAIHQFGGVIVPVSADALHFVIGGRHIFAQRVVMPPRPYLGIAGEEIEEITDLARIYFETPTSGLPGGARPAS